MVGWPYQLNGHESEQTPGDSEGQGSLASCSPWGLKELDTTERLNHNNPSGIWKKQFIVRCQTLELARCRGNLLAASGVKELSSAGV